jgi:hypothetical protein
MNNPHLWRKRQLIESGALTTWSRRGGTYAGTHWPWIETALQVGLGVSLNLSRFVAAQKKRRVWP